MSDTVTLEQIVDEAKRLPPEDRLRLIQRVAETLLPGSALPSPRPLRYGEFAGATMSRDEDFVVAEWRPSENELDGR
jgi:hypothetical protein